VKALITGITGMAGSYLAEHLIARGDQGRQRGQSPHLGSGRFPGRQSRAFGELRGELNLVLNSPPQFANRHSKWSAIS
jgi:hypothetical protein